MEENKGKFTVIFVSYKKETLTMIESNPGLRARITKCIEFENYEPEELFDIAKIMLFNSKYEMDDELICDLAISIFKNSKNKNYGNARDVRNALESLYQIQAERTIDDFGNMKITRNDLDTYFKEIKYV